MAQNLVKLFLFPGLTQGHELIIQFHFLVRPLKCPGLKFGQETRDIQEKEFKSEPILRFSSLELVLG